MRRSVLFETEASQSLSSASERVLRFKESSEPDLPERDFLADHDPYELLGRFQVAFFFVVASPLYPFAASEVMFKEVLCWRAVLSWVSESI